MTRKVVLRTISISTAVCSMCSGSIVLCDLFHVIVVCFHSEFGFFLCSPPIELFFVAEIYCPKIFILKERLQCIFS